MNPGAPRWEEEKEGTGPSLSTRSRGRERAAACHLGGVSSHRELSTGTLLLDFPNCRMVINRGRYCFVAGCISACSIDIP